MKDVNSTTHNVQRTNGAVRFAQHGKLVIIFLLAVAFMSPVGFASEKSWPDELAKISVQQGGRVKPFESFAREAILYVTGRTAWEKKPATQTVWEWIVSPYKWVSQPLIYVGSPQVREEFGLKLIGKRVSAEVVMGEKSFVQKVEDAMHRREKRESLSFTDKKRIEIYDRAVFLEQLGDGVVPGWIPEPQNPHGAWLRFADFAAEPAEWMRNLPQTELQNFKKSAEVFATTFKSEKPDNAAQLTAAQGFKQALDAVWTRAGLVMDQGLINREVFYNNLHAFGRGSKLYLLAALLFVINIFSRRRRAKQERDYSFLLGLTVYIAAMVLHILGFYLRCVISGRAPVTNMYESIVWVSLAVAIFALPIYFYVRQLAVIVTSSLVAALVLLVAESFPAVLDPALSPLVPVLRSNFWLTIHVLSITMSYGAFALAWGLGHGVVFGYAFRKTTEKKEGLNALAYAAYRAIQIGVVLLAAGTILGGVWANYSWGRFWGWDPKETWALIALIGYLVVLHARFIGWVGPFGIAMGAILAFMGVIMAWYGVNFVLAAGLHSYGFGGGGYPYVSSFVLLDLVLVGFAAYWYQKKTKA